MTKKNSNLAIEQEKAEISASSEQIQATKEKSKSLEERRKEFDRLELLFSKKARFELALDKLANFESGLQSEDPANFESGKFTLELSNSYNREEIKVSNKEVLFDVVTYLKSRISSKISTIEAEIMQS